MSTMSIVEGQAVGKQASGEIQAMMLPFITLQNVTFTGSAGYSAATNSNTGLVRIYVDAACKVIASTTSSAAITSLSGISMTASTFEYFAVPKGQSIYFSVVGVGV